LSKKIDYGTNNFGLLFWYRQLFSKTEYGSWFSGSQSGVGAMSVGIGVVTIAPPILATSDAVRAAQISNHRGPKGPKTL